MFNNCESILHLNLSNFNTSNATDMNNIIPSPFLISYKEERKLSFEFYSLLYALKASTDSFWVQPLLKELPRHFCCYLQSKSYRTDISVHHSNFQRSKNLWPDTRISLCMMPPQACCRSQHSTYRLSFFPFILTKEALAVTPSYYNYCLFPCHLLGQLSARFTINASVQKMCN